MRKILTISPRHFLVATAIGVLAGGAASHGFQHETRFNSLTLRLSVSPEVFLPLEPIPLTLSLENTTQQAIRGHSALGFSMGLVDVEVTRPGSRPIQADQLATDLEQAIQGSGLIRPGDRYVSTDMLIIGLDTLMPDLGSYVIRVKVSGMEAGEELWSNPVRIRIRQPSGVDLEAHQFILHSGRARYFLTGSPSVQPNEEEQLDTFIRLYGQTAYGDFAALVLARRAIARGDRETARMHLSTIATKPTFQNWRRAAAVAESVGLGKPKG